MNYQKLIKQVKRIVNIIGGFFIGLLVVATVFMGAGFSHPEIFKEVILDDGIELMNVKITGETILTKLDHSEFMKVTFLETLLILISSIIFIYFFNKLVNTWESKGIFSVSFLKQFRLFIIFSVTIGVLVNFVSYRLDLVVFSAVNKVTNELVITPEFDFKSSVVELVILLLVYYVLSKGLKIKEEQDLTI
ncbi:hypothetical protein [Enterococcus faecalis]|uniref:hypothetical protein n=1 Tax=Enterococcus faecalis TaxID=1351 RepID=UPI0039A7000D